MKICWSLHVPFNIPYSTSRSIFYVPYSVFNLQHVSLPGITFLHILVHRKVPRILYPLVSINPNTSAFPSETKIQHPALPAMPLNRRELVSSSIYLLRKALLALQSDQHAVNVLHGQEIPRFWDGEETTGFSRRCCAWNGNATPDYSPHTLMGTAYQTLTRLLRGGQFLAQRCSF